MVMDRPEFTGPVARVLKPQWLQRRQQPMSAKFVEEEMKSLVAKISNVLEHHRQLGCVLKMTERRRAELVQLTTIVF